MTMFPFLSAKPYSPVFLSFTEINPSDISMFPLGSIPSGRGMISPFLYMNPASNAEGGVRRMWMGERFAGERFYDALGNCPEPVAIDGGGWGDFRTASRNVSVWVRDAAFEDLLINE